MKFHWLLLALGLCTACNSGEVRETLGLNKDAPDEFRVVSRPPLSVPPEFHLRPPAPGEAPIGAPAAETVGRSLVLEDDGSDMTTRILQKPSVETAVDPVNSGSLASTGEANLLSKAGTADADPTIRSQLHQDEKEAPEVEEEVTPLESWMGVKPSDPVVDPKAEAERIRENKDAGKPVNEGDVKTVDPKKDSVIDKIF